MAQSTVMVSRRKILFPVPFAFSFLLSLLLSLSLSLSPFPFSFPFPFPFLPSPFPLFCFLLSLSHSLPLSLLLSLSPFPFSFLLFSFLLSPAIGWHCPRWLRHLFSSEKIFPRKTFVEHTSPLLFQRFDDRNVRSRKKEFKLQMG